MLVDMTEKLGPEVRLHAEGAPRELITAQLRNAIGELCERSGVWRESLPAMEAIKGLADYEIDMPYYAALVLVVSVAWDGTPLAFAEIDEVNLRSGDPTSPSTNQPSEWTLPAFGTVRLLPAPDADQDAMIEPHVAIRPAVDQVEIPDWMLRWSEGLAAGAITRLMAIPNKPWTGSAGQLDYHRGRFEEAVGDAARLAVTGFRGHMRQTNPMSIMPDVKRARGGTVTKPWEP